MEYGGGGGSSYSYWFLLPSCTRYVIRTVQSVTVVQYE